MPANLPKGTYVVAWRVISADSHPVHGAYVFSISTASGASKANAEATTLSDQSGSAVVGAIYWFIRFAAFVGLLFLVGLALMVTLTWRPGGATRRVGRLLWASWWVLLAAAVLAVAGVAGALLHFGPDAAVAAKRARAAHDALLESLNLHDPGRARLGDGFGGGGAGGSGGGKKQEAAAAAGGGGGGTGKATTTTEGTTTTTVPPPAASEDASSSPSEGAAAAASEE